MKCKIHAVRNVILGVSFCKLQYTDADSAFGSMCRLSVGTLPAFWRCDPMCRVLPTSTRCRKPENKQQQGITLKP
jgi:hypothetical protein